MNFLQRPLAKLAHWMTHSDEKYIYSFDEGSDQDIFALGSKGASLCELSRLKMPVPHGFTISSEACRNFLHHGGQMSPIVEEQYKEAIQSLEKYTKCQFGWSMDTAGNNSSQFPLLLSIRSSTAVDMPGMMSTVLNVGMNEEVVKQLTSASGNYKFALDTYRHFLKMFGTVILGREKALYEDAAAEICTKAGVDDETTLSEIDLELLVDEFAAITQAPVDPWEQLRLAVEGVYRAWPAPKAAAYRDARGIPSELGVAVTIQAMVFGNFDEQSGTGIGFTRNPATGEDSVFGEFLSCAVGDEVLKAGTRNPKSLAELCADLPAVYDRLMSAMGKLEKHFKDMQEIEFAVQKGRLYILQSHSGKRTARAGVRMSVEMVREGLLTERESLTRVDAEQMEFFQHPMIDPRIASYALAGVVGCTPEQDATILGRGLVATAGVICGRLIFTSAGAVALASNGRGKERAVLCRVETGPDDDFAIECSAGLLTIRGGLTSHAAFTARTHNKSAVIGAGLSGMRIECVNVVADESSTAFISAQSAGGVGGAVRRSVSVAESTLKLAAKKAARSPPRRKYLDVTATATATGTADSSSTSRGEAEVQPTHTPRTTPRTTPSVEGAAAAHSGDADADADEQEESSPEPESDSDIQGAEGGEKKTGKGGLDVAVSAALESSNDSCQPHTSPSKRALMLYQLVCADGTIMREGDYVTLDASTGVVYAGEVTVPMVPPSYDANYQTLLNWADKYKRMAVLANADTVEEVVEAFNLGAEGIGVLRTEKLLFHPSRSNFMCAIALAETEEERRAALQKLLPLHEHDLHEIFRAAKGRQVTVRLMDPPLQEFLPDPRSDTFDREIESLADHLGISDDICERRVRRLVETNPLMGFRGTRVCVVHPEIVEMQTLAIIGASFAVAMEGIPIEPEILFPLVCSDKEIEEISPVVENAATAAAVQISAIIKRLNEQEKKAKEEESEEGRKVEAKKEEEKNRISPKGEGGGEKVGTVTEATSTAIDTGTDTAASGRSALTGPHTGTSNTVSTGEKQQQQQPSKEQIASNKYVDALLKYRVGAMIEVPRACVRCDRIITEGDVSFATIGTDELTQLVYGFSRQDMGKYLVPYLQRHILAADPFTTLDQRGVGALIRNAVHKSRKANPAAKIGASGVHAGNPASIQFFDSLGMDYISCPREKIPTAKIAAAQAHIESINRDRALEWAETLGIANIDIRDITSTY